MLVGWLGPDAGASCGGAPPAKLLSQQSQSSAWHKYVKTPSLPSLPFDLQAGSDLTTEQAVGAQPLRDNLVEKRDYWLLHGMAWQLLKSW